MHAQRQRFESHGGQRCVEQDDQSPSGGWTAMPRCVLTQEGQNTGRQSPGSTHWGGWNGWNPYNVRGLCSRVGFSSVCSCACDSRMEFMQRWRCMQVESSGMHAVAPARIYTKWVTVCISDMHARVIVGWLSSPARISCQWGLSMWSEACAVSLSRSCGVHMGGGAL
jgi:hypothetical protein